MSERAQRWVQCDADPAHVTVARGHAHEGLGASRAVALVAHPVRVRAVVPRRLLPLLAAVVGVGDVLVVQQPCEAVRE